MTAILRRERIVNHKRVRRMMTALSLSVRPRRKWVRTTDSDHSLGVYPNLLKGVAPQRMNEVWVADITYIGLQEGFVYLAVILDRYSRKVVGWSLGKRITSELTQAALVSALERRGPVAGCIHHSDRGVQYASKDYVAKLIESGLRPSMSRRGNPYDNAHAESFMKTFKVENVYLRQYRTYEQVIEGVPGFIEAVYNCKRLHSSLGYLSPEEFETQNIKTDAIVDTTA